MNGYLLAIGIMFIPVIGIGFDCRNGIRIWWRRRQAHKAEVRWQNGYDYAAGALLRGTAPHEVAAYTESARDFDTYDEFDAGVDEALRDWPNSPVPDQFYGLEAMDEAEFRAYEYGCTMAHVHVLEILDGKDTGGGVAREPWESIRRRLLALVAA